MEMEMRSEMERGGEGETEIAEGMYSKGIAALINCNIGALIKKKIKFSSYIRKFRVGQLQSHI
jgi:hypothetical protein